MITREFNLYLHAGHSIPLVINVNQYDRGETWVFTLFNADGTQYTPSSGAIVGIKSDNLGIINTATVDSQGRVVINETQQMTAAVGKAVFELLIDDQTHGTANFVVLVEAKPGDNADLSETDISMIEQAIEAASTIKPYGSPLVASTVAGMTDHDKVYVYVGSETGYTSGNWYYWDGSAWTSGGVYNSVAVQTDTTLALSGVAADSKKVGDEISDLKSQISNSMPSAVKHALDAMLLNMVVKDDDVFRDEYNTFHTWAYAVNLLSISAVYTQSGTVYDCDSLDILRSDLVVTASYDDGTTSVVTGYTLSGDLTEGTSAITVSYDGKTTSFNVTVEHALYRLAEPFASTGTEYIDTGVEIEANNQYSVAVDITLGSTIPVSSIRCAVGNVGSASKYLALQTQKYTSGSDTGTYLWGGGLGYGTSKNYAVAEHRYRYVYTFDASTYERFATLRDITADAQAISGGGTATAEQINGNNIYIGSQDQVSTVSNGFIGTVNECIIYDRILSAQEITDYLEG